jgi:hypothetical protein
VPTPAICGLKTPLALMPVPLQIPPGLLTEFRVTKPTFKQSAVSIPAFGKTGVIFETVIESISTQPFKSVNV